MNYYKIGCNFDRDLLHGVIALNDKYASESKIYEFYGSLPEYDILTARPLYRLPQIDRAYFNQYVDLCQREGISFNYVMNSSYIGSKMEISRNLSDLRAFIQYLIDAGIRTITITNPLIAEIIRSVSTSITIEISTIAI